MNTSTPLISNKTYWTKAIAILALIFGVMTLVSGGSVLFGPNEARDLAGAYVPFVVWFNFLAGFFYIFAAIGIWLQKSWAFNLSIFIAAMTALIAVAFSIHLVQGGQFEFRTVGALALRTGFWVAISIYLYRVLNRS